MTTATYHVVAERSGDWWAITVAEVMIARGMKK